MLCYQPVVGLYWLYFPPRTQNPTIALELYTSPLALGVDLLIFYRLSFTLLQYV